MPPQLLTMAFGLAQTCPGNAVTIWFLLPFLFDGVFNIFLIFPYCYGLLIEFVQNIATTSILVIDYS